MRLTALALENWLAHRHAQFSLAPLTLFTGPNESGKSSVRDGIAFAMLGSLSRISAKGDRPLLLSFGAQKGHVALHCGLDAEAMVCGRDIATGKLRGKGVAMPIGSDTVTAAVPYCLDPSLFAKATPDERGTLLLAIMRVPMDPASIQTIVLERGHARANDIPPDLALDGWVLFCERQASEARGAWKAITGETYGAVKAETWAITLETPAPEPGEQARLEQDVAGLQAQLAQLREAKGAADQMIRARLARESRIADLRAQLKDREAMTKVVTMAEAQVADAKTAEAKADAAHAEQVNAKPAALVCVRCGTRHVIEGGKLIEKFDDDGPLVASEAERLNAAAHLARAKGNVQIAETALSGARARLKRVDDAESALRELEAIPAEAEADIEAVISQMARIETQDLPAKLDRLAALRASEADTQRALWDTAQAKAQHEAVQEWMALAEVLKPSGLPTELLTDALAKFNSVVLDIAQRAKWTPPAIIGDKTIHRAGTPYALLSESGQWRVDLLLTVAIAMVSGVKIVVADRFDVLQVSARRGLLEWLYGATKRGEIDTAILLGTLQSPPDAPKDVMVHWLGERA